MNIVIPAEKVESDPNSKKSEKRETHKILPHFEMVEEYPNIKINTDFLKEDKNNKCCNIS